jgi:DNA-damage-inducible protein J
MAKREVARARIDAELKHNVEALLGKLGLSVSEAIRIYFRMIELNGGLPFEIKIPNEETAAVFRDTDRVRISSASTMRRSCSRTSACDVPAGPDAPLQERRSARAP